MTERAPWTEDEFEQALKLRRARYHANHPFDIAMNKGLLDPDQLRAWVANRFYYQINIPIKDAAILANCHDRAVRRQWVKRILDHDGSQDEAGGIESWVQLGLAVGLDKDRLWSLELVYPGVRFAVDAYINKARQCRWQEAVAMSLTEWFAVDLHRKRLAHWPTLYPWIEPSGLRYFQSRVKLATEDVKHGWSIVKSHFNTFEKQQQALALLDFKLDILWSILDAIAVQTHYVTPNQSLSMPSLGVDMPK